MVLFPFSLVGPSVRFSALQEDPNPSVSILWRHPISREARLRGIIVYKTRRFRDTLQFPLTAHHDTPPYPLQSDNLA